MKRILKITVVIMAIIIAAINSGCEKPQEQPIIIEQPDDLYHITFQLPEWNIDFQDVEYSRGNLCNGPNGEITGEVIRFESIEAQYTGGIIIQVMKEFGDISPINGKIVQVTGQLPDVQGNIHPFTIYNDTLRICNGPQTVNFTLNLYKQ